MVQSSTERRLVALERQMIARTDALSVCRQAVALYETGQPLPANWTPEERELAICFVNTLITTADLFPGEAR
jgi:hypothetical protein